MFSMIRFLTAAIGNGKKVFDPRGSKMLLTKSKATLKVVYERYFVKSLG